MFELKFAKKAKEQLEAIEGHADAPELIGAVGPWFLGGCCRVWPSNSRWVALSVDFPA